LITVLKDSGSSLVSIENLSKILPSASWAQVRYQQPKMAKNLPYDVTHEKPETQNQKFCLVFRGFEQLSSTIRCWSYADGFRPISKYDLFAD